MEACVDELVSVMTRVNRGSKVRSAVEACMEARPEQSEG